VTDTPLIPGSLFGLRCWRLGVDDDGEYLTGAWQRVRWPCSGAWMEATCVKDTDHPAPEATCSCGVHAWHPRRWSARRILATRHEVPGIVEAFGAIELQEDGFRAQWGKPYAFVVTPGRNAALVRRLARRYGVEVVEVESADALVAWCRERGLGMAEDAVAEALGPETLAAQRSARRRRLRRDVVRSVAAAALSIGLVAAGLQFASGPASADRLYGRTGWVVPGGCPKSPDGPAAAPTEDPGRAPSDRPC
jgi:hypothetical protein